MESQYHRSITASALAGHFSPAPLAAIIQANVDQDRWIYLIGHPEFHFDESAFEAGYAYLAAQTEIVLKSLAGEPDVQAAWAAFGRMCHAFQDFYAHSNYTRLWAEVYANGSATPGPDAIDPLVPEFLHNPRLMSGKVYLPLEGLTLIPALRPLARRLLPADSHANMNLDDPSRGWLFPYAISAAKKRTKTEAEMLFDTISQQLGESALARFLG